jgi:hypothetical protein
MSSKKQQKKIEAPAPVAAPLPPADEPKKAVKKSVKKAAVPAAVPVAAPAPVAVAAPEEEAKKEKKARKMRVLAPADVPAGVAEAAVKKPRQFKQKTLRVREMRRFRFGKDRGIPLVKRAVAERLVRSAIRDIPGLQGLSLEEKEIFGLMGASADEPEKPRIRAGVVDDIRDAVEAFTLRRLELIACLVNHDKEMTASAKHLATLDAMEDVTY